LQRFEDWLSLRGKPEAASPAVLSEHDLERLDREPAQKQADQILERAINHYDGANDQIAERVGRWRGRLKLTADLNALMSTALNSNDLRVRAAGIEVELAAYNVAKTHAEAVRLEEMAGSNDHASKIWALWMLGAVANRGVDRDAITETLIAHLKDEDAASRQWAVEGLALVGSDATITPLLGAFRDDASPTVRERAACSLAQSGMLTQDQRMTAVPTILTYTDDPALDAQTHTWAFQALRDITGQNLQNDPAAWRDWWQSRGQ
jgi:HEAT repeat protein